MYKLILKSILSATFAASIALGLAMAGNGTFKHSSGAKVKIKCSNAGCFVRETSATGEKGKNNKVGPGGRANYQKHVKKWNAKGYH